MAAKVEEVEEVEEASEVEEEGEVEKDMVGVGGNDVFMMIRSE